MSQLRFEPDPRYSSSNPAPVAAEFEALHAKLGKLVINRKTYRPVRWLARLTRKKPNEGGVTIRQDKARFGHSIMVEPDEIKGDGALVLIHGGGFVIGNAWDVVPKAAHFARTLGVKVLCPAYRLAPQAPAPAPLEDCHKAWVAFVADAERQGIDPARIVLGGYSAGAGYAACLAQRLRNEGGPTPASQLLVYPMLDDRTAANRDLDEPRHSVWSNQNNLFGWTSLLGHAPGQACAPCSVAARASDLSNLPPAWIGVGSCDLFLDEDRAYAEALRQAGVATDYVEAEGAIHGFDMAPTPLAQAFVDQQIAFLERFVS